MVRVIDFGIPQSDFFLGIGEWYSPVVPGTGLHPRPGSALSLQQYFPEIDPDTWSSIWYPSRKGEYVEEVHSRIDGFLTDFARILPQLKGKGIDVRRPLFVSHAATVIVLVRSLTGERDMALRVGCCSLSELHPKEGGKSEEVVGMYRGVKLADGTHLKKGTEREWGMEDIEVEAGRVSRSLLIMNPDG
jgi:transcription factor C subunit 7